MFRPTYRYTTKLVDSLLRTESARSAIEVVTLPTGTAKELQEQRRQDSLRAIELLAGEPVTAYEPSLSLVAKRVPNCPDEQTFQRLHAGLTGGDESPYRSTSEIVYDQNRSDVVYVPPDGVEVPRLVQELLDWLKLAWERVPAVVVAGICQQQLAMIRPFEQCSTSFALLAGDLVLSRRGYALGGFTSVQAGLARDLEAYAAAATSAHTGVYPSQADFTAWLEFFAASLAAVAAEAREAVLARASGVVSKSDLAAADGPVALRDRQRQGLEYIRLNGAIRSGQYQELVRIVPDTARRDFVDLMDKGLIAVRGVGRGTYYVLTTRGAEEIERLKR